VCGLSFVLTALSLLLLALTLESPGVHIFTYWAEDTVGSLAFSTIGAIIVSHRPEHPIGWLFCVMGLLAGIDHLCGEYAIYALLAHPGTLPAGEAGAWVRSWVWDLYIGIGMFLVLLFPDGRLPSRRWRPFAWSVVSVVFLSAIALAFSPEPVDGLGPIENPLGIELLGFFAREVDVVAVVEALLFIPLATVAAGSLLVRMRRSRGVERQQIKWFAYAEVVLVIGTITAYTITEARSVPWWVPSVGFLLTMVGIAGWGIGVAIAILRHRLYDIDRLINRTLVYGSLTLMLALVYFGGVTATQAFFHTLTGQEEQPQLAIVVSTLVIAALFTPLRRRIQSFIDRRFYRRKYDARKTLEAFSTKLKNETDLEALNNDLVGVVRETMQPAHVSLWLRPDPAQKGEQAE
jgi:hypothetical protein